MYSVRGSELARTGNSNPQKIRCVVELLDDSEYIVDLEVSKIIFSTFIGIFMVNFVEILKTALLCQ